MREALAVFLDGLPAAAQDAILASQAALPLTAGTAQRLAALAKECPVLHKLGQRPRQWLIQVPATESRYWRAIGTAHSLADRARDMGQRWLCGLGMARAIEKAPAG